ncbi:MAG TPA: dienelactone hydrolase family protein [Nitrospirota bacterium]
MLMLLIFAALSFSFGPGNAGAEVRTQTVEYKQDKTALEGYLAYDDAMAGRRPGILVVHEWTGLGPYVKRRCEQLAKLGYVAFGADIYGKGVRPQSHEEAGKVSSAYMNDRKVMRARVKAGLDELKKSKFTDSSKIAAIGYCFGGAAVLELARSGADIAGVVTFHGLLANPTPEDAKDIKAKVLVNLGADDPMVDRKQVDAFIEEMRKTKVDWRMDIYGGAVHSFTVPEAGNDPSKGLAYNERADKRSWQAMMNFFDEIFKKGGKK